MRDAQHFLGVLADEGVTIPDKIAATGGSYGGGMSMALGALRNRTMMADGSLVPWESPDGTAMEIAVAAPEIPWTDLATSLMPSGSTLDYVADAPYKGPNGDRRIGIMKQSFVSLLYGAGLALSNYAPPNQDEDADLTEWYALINAGEPYDENPEAADVTEEVTEHHSSYYIDDSIPPAPMLISNGWTDDLFPGDEAIRFYNRTRTNHPGADISMMFLDYGHQRGQGKGADTSKLRQRQETWFDWYLKGEGAEPSKDVRTLTQTCPGSAPSAGPFSAPTWAEAAPGEVRHSSAAQQVIQPETGNPLAGQAFDPIAGGGACASASGLDQAGAANYRLPAAPAGGYTLMGSPTIVADFLSVGPTSQVAARLLDVGPDGQETLVARGLWRVDRLQTSPSRQVFQLHPNGWKFAEGHIPKLELLPADPPYGRISNGQLPVAVSNLELRLPVLESPNGGPIKQPAGKILPPGYELAADFVAGNDGDDDGWPNDSDNCPNDANADQADDDGDGTGDACDATDDDSDNDHIQDSADNCPNTANPLQEDADNDNVGDACEADNDRDDDDVPDVEDNCPDDANQNQEDDDNDEVGNACETRDDADDDDVFDDQDNCPDHDNPPQEDVDRDGQGDACDATDDDPDRDGVLNASDNCDDAFNPNQEDADGDGQGDACDSEPAGTCAGATGTIAGTSGNDTIDGTSGRDVIVALGGNDTIRGVGGNDVVCGGGGNDLIFGGNDSDKLYGESGKDDVRGDAGTDLVDGGFTDDKLYGGTGNDTLKGRTGNDRLSGNDGNDALYGHEGADTCYGGAGSNTFSSC